MKATTGVARLIPERLREAREARGFNVLTFADALGISRQAVSQFETGQSTPSAEVMSKIIELLALPPTFFTTPRPYSRDASGTIFWRSLRRFQRDERNRLARQLEWAQDILDYLEKFVEFPLPNLPAFEWLNPEHLHDENMIENAADELRQHWGLGKGPIPNVVNLLEANGVLVIREKTESEDMDALSGWQRGRPIVLLSADKNVSVRSRFDAAHELGHLLLHTGVELDSLNLSRVEKQSNRFASAFLLPRASFTKEVLSTSLAYFETLKKRWKVSIAAMIYRCKDLHLLSENQVQYLWKQRTLKMKTFEPLDDEIPIEEPILLKKAIAMVLDHGIQTKQDFLESIPLNRADIEKLSQVAPGTLNTNVISFELKRRKGGNMSA